MSEKIVRNWLALAEYDLKTADAMLQAERYLYVVFTCQQAIDKLLKAIYVDENQQTPPYTHNLLRLVDSLKISKTLNEEKNSFLETLNSYYIESRYTEEISELSGLLDREKAEQVFSSTRELFSWLKSQIE